MTTVTNEELGDNFEQREDDAPRMDIDLDRRGKWERIGDCYKTFCNFIFAPHEELWWPPQCPPRKYILTKTVARLDPNAYNPFDEFYALHEAYPAPCCLGFLTTAFATMIVLYYAYLMFVNYIKNFSPVTSHLSTLGTDYAPLFGGCSDTATSEGLSVCSLQAGNVFVTFMLASGNYLVSNVSTFAVAFSHANMAMNGSTFGATTLASTIGSSTYLYADALQIPAVFMSSDANAYLQGSLGLDSSSTQKVIEIKVTPGNSTSYSSMASLMAGGSFEIYQYMAGSSSITSESITNPTYWRIRRFPFANGTVLMNKMVYRQKRMSFTSRWQYKETFYDILEAVKTHVSRFSLSEATNKVGTSDLLYHSILSLDITKVTLRYERVTLMDYMNQIGGVAFCAFFGLWLIKWFYTDQAFKTEKIFRPRKSAIERIVRKKQEELEYYNEMLLINPNVAKDAGVTPKVLRDFLKRKQGEEMAHFVQALETAFLFQASKDLVETDPLQNVRKRLRDEFGDQVMSNVDFQYSSDTIEVDAEDGIMLAKVVNIIAAEKLKSQIEEMNTFMAQVDRNLNADVRATVDL